MRLRHVGALAGAILVFFALALDLAARPAAKATPTTEKELGWTEDEVRQILGDTLAGMLPETLRMSASRPFFHWGVDASIAMLSAKGRPDKTRYEDLIEDAVRTFKAAVGGFGLKAGQTTDLADANMVFVVVPKPYSMARNAFGEILAVVVPNENDRVHFIAQAEAKERKCFGAPGRVRLQSGRTVTWRLVWFIDDDISTREAQRCLHLGLLVAFGFPGIELPKPGILLSNQGGSDRISGVEMNLIHAIYEHQPDTVIVVEQLIRRIFQK